MCSYIRRCMPSPSDAERMPGATTWRCTCWTDQSSTSVWRCRRPHVSRGEGRLKLAAAGGATGHLPSPSAAARHVLKRCRTLRPTRQPAAAPLALPAGKPGMAFPANSTVFFLGFGRIATTAESFETPTVLQQASAAAGEGCSQRATLPLVHPHSPATPVKTTHPPIHPPLPPLMGQHAAARPGSPPPTCLPCPGGAPTTTTPAPLPAPPTPGQLAL